ncbi:DUF1128 domain-containing protein [Bacillus sp. N9]
MNLTINSRENIEYMLNEIVTKLKMVNIGAVKLDNLDEERYEELHEIYEMVMKKNSFSPSEMQALAEELGQLRRA